VQISVRLLYEDGKRLTHFRVRTQRPFLGWLFLEVVRDDYQPMLRARLVDDAGADILWLDHAHVNQAKGSRGMLIEGVSYRRKGRKHSIANAQAWWCHAPPKPEPFLDNAARISAAEHRYDEEQRRFREEADLVDGALPAAARSSAGQ